MSSFFISVDLGQAADYTAISVLEKIDDELSHIRHLERLPIGMSYPKQVERIKQIYEAVTDVEIIVDYTGVGRAVVDLMKEESMNPYRVTITGGTEARHEGLEWHIPKRDIVFGLITALQTNRLKIAKQLPSAAVLENELMNFKLKVNIKTGHDSYEAWREGQHDDLVLSVGMAVYAANRINQNWLFIDGF